MWRVSIPYCEGQRLDVAHEEASHTGRRDRAFTGPDPKLSIFLLELTPHAPIQPLITRSTDITASVPSSRTLGAIRVDQVVQCTRI
ncbi:unspecified product [Leishmania tarentolae]|uniref:Unspecified product n=1 Tax=Leishmania tarentolae TaxID=5689 RepID=A0A640KF36_LEITA|nr:unspecified product [Leishmania tarentolae]